MFEEAVKAHTSILLKQSENFNQNKLQLESLLKREDPQAVNVKAGGALQPIAQGTESQIV